jgi:hypothetical protein
LRLELENAAIPGIASILLAMPPGIAYHHTIKQNADPQMGIGVF